ncbi:MAG TPA: MiaB/RimO family radical SAM methylthiotransferase [Desulfomonilia bacterium]|nr:MiaB/RimO family radical SAM methylthiotransferase [Desulfomonilia bacterium]
MRFAIITLGCKVNQYESQRIREGLLAAGHTEQAFTQPGADCYIVNTCTITHKSDAEGRRIIRRALRHRGRVVVTGCQVIVDPKGIRDVSEVIEIARPDHLSEMLQVDLPNFISGFHDHSRAFVKVQQGCDKYCTYCIVPLAKGRPISRPWQEVVTEVKALHEKGYQEIVLTGINIGLYEGGLSRLVERIFSHSALPRLRISSIEPWTLEDCLVSMITSEPRLCKHLHLPLQHGNDMILRAMGRPYSAEYVGSLIGRIKDTSPEVAIGLDIIAGFPGENEKIFEESYGFLEDLDVTYLHVFPFSPREGTSAALLPGRPDETDVKRRAAFLRQLSQEKRLSFALSRQGSIEGVLVMQSCAGRFSGVTSNYLKVQAPGDAAVGSIVDARLTGMEGQTIRGEVLG